MHLKDMSDAPESDSKMEMAEPSRGPSYPYGLCLRLTEKELERLGLSEEVEVGDYLHGVFMAKVTHVSTHAHEGGKGCGVELQIVAMGVEDENTEYQEDEDDEDEE